MILCWFRHFNARHSALSQHGPCPTSDRARRVQTLFWILSLRECSHALHQADQTIRREVWSRQLRRTEDLQEISESNRETVWGKFYLLLALRCEDHLQRVPKGVLIGLQSSLCWLEFVLPDRNSWFCSRRIPFPLCEWWKVYFLLGCPWSRPEALPWFLRDPACAKAYLLCLSRRESSHLSFWDLKWHLS